MRRIRQTDLVLNEPLPWALHDEHGNLLLRQGYVITMQRHVDSLLARGVFVREAGDDARKALDAAAGKLRAKGIAVNTLLRAGDPRDAVVEAAKETSADLLVIGTHGRRGLERLFVGSVAEHAVRYAPCPVLTIRDPQKQ